MWGMICSLVFFTSERTILMMACYVSDLLNPLTALPGCQTHGSLRG